MLNTGSVAFLRASKSGHHFIFNPVVGSYFRINKWHLQMKSGVGRCASRILFCFSLFILYWSGNSSLLLRHGIYPLPVISVVKLATDKLTTTTNRNSVLNYFKTRSHLALAAVLCCSLITCLGISRGFVFNTEMLLMTCSSSFWLLSISLLCWFIS